MNLTWHIVKKDLRCLRWPLALWTLLIATKLGVGVALLTADGTEGLSWFSRMDALTKVLAWLEGISFVLVAALIQEDMLVGTSAFWVTRPISGARLLRAKLLGIGLIFGVLPVLVTLPWWLGCGYGLREIAWAALETVGIGAVFVLLGLLWAVVTDGLGRFLMWTLVSLVAIPTSAVTVGYYVSRLHPSLSGELIGTRVGVEVVIAVLGILIVVVHQFLTRNLWRSIAVIGASSGLIVAVGLWWPWTLGMEARWQSFLTRRAEATWPEAAEPRGLTFAVDKAGLVRGSSTRPDARVQLRVNYRVQGLPESQWLMPAYVNNYTLRWSDGFTDHGWSWFRSGGAWYDTASLKLLGLPPKPMPTTWGPEDSQAFQLIPVSVASRLQVEPARYTLQAHFAVMESDSPVTVPLQPGAWDTFGTAGERIAHVEKEGEELLVTFVRHRPAFLSDTLMGLTDYATGVGLANIPRYSQYLLVNHTGKFVDQGTEQTTFTYCVGTVSIVVQTMAYRAIKGERGKRPTLAGINALNEAEFTKLVFRGREKFTHEFKVYPFVVEPAQP